jgi:HSP20 family protein
MIPVLRKRVYLPFHRDDFFRENGLSSFFSDGADYNVPAVNIKENENQFEIEVAAPGLTKEDFKVKLDKNVLTVTSEKESKAEEERENFMRKEFNFNSFCRSFSVPEIVDVEKISASHKNGVLIIELPKHNEAKMKPNREIKVQ